MRGNRESVATPREKVNVVASVLILAVFAIAYRYARGLRAPADLFPEVVALLGILVSCAYLVVQVRGLLRSHSTATEPVDGHDSEVLVDGQELGELSRRTLVEGLIVILAMLALAWSIERFGFLMSGIVLLMLSNRLISKVSVPRAVLFTAVFFVAFVSLALALGFVLPGWPFR
jgi:hypothetical protein